MIDVLRIARLRIAPQEGNSEVGNCEVHPLDWLLLFLSDRCTVYQTHDTKERGSHSHHSQ